MEFLQEILPFLLFLGILISRSKKKATRTMNRKNSVPRINPNPKKEHTIQRSIEKHKPIERPQVLDIEKATNNTLNEEDELEDYILKNRNEFEMNINTPGIVTKTVEESGSSLQNIRRLKFDKSNLVNSIIMAEVLGKPKALRK